jgi:hypothetical protein
MAPSHLSHLLELLDTAATEIARLDSPSNPVCVQLRSAQEKHRPARTTVGELAARTDLPVRDVLDAVIDAGVQIFWHEGQLFRSPSALRSYLAMSHLFDPVSDVEFDWTIEQSESMAVEWGLDPEQLFSELAHSAGRRARRKFVPSERSYSGDSQSDRAELG